MVNRSFVIIAIVVVVILLVLAGKKTNKTEDTSAAGQVVKEDSSQGSAAIGGDFTLTNQRGEKISTDQFRGKLLLVYFGFATCPAICPADLSNISSVMQQLGENADKVVPLFITIDPERDTVESLSTYMQNYDTHIQALTGTAEEIATAAKLYKVYYKRMEADAMPGGYTMDHSAFTYLMDKDGKYITHFTHNEDIEKIVRAIEGNL